MVKPTVPKEAKEDVKAKARESHGGQYLRVDPIEAASRQFSPQRLGKLLPVRTGRGPSVRSPRPLCMEQDGTLACGEVALLQETANKPETGQ